MKRTFFSHIATYKHFFCVILAIIATTYNIKAWGQHGGDYTTEELASQGFENVRWTENQEERIYTIENNAYKIQTDGISQAIETIQKYGLPDNKRCKVIVTQFDIPEISLTLEPLNKEKDVIGKWNVSYDMGKSWKEVKKEQKKNSSRYKVDILIYPQLSFQNMDITKIYQAMFSLNPSLEVSFWKGMKLAGQVILPLYVDTEGYAAYSPLYKKVRPVYKKVRPGFVTLAQRIRLPYNIKGKATVGFFNYDQHGVDLQLMRPFKDERFSLEARLGYTGWGYWDAFKYKYNGEYQWTWSCGGNFFWPRYDVQFSLKAEQYLLGEKGFRFDMIRHFKYASVGFYAMKAEGAKSNGGFRFQVALPTYKHKRHKYIPRINMSRNMGIIYNAGNERKYYRQYRAETSDNIMEQNSLNPIYIEKKLYN